MDQPERVYLHTPRLHPGQRSPPCGRAVSKAGSAPAPGPRAAFAALEAGMVTVSQGADALPKHTKRELCL